MEFYGYQRSRSFIDLGPNLSDSIFLNFFSSITTRPIEAKLHVEILRMGEWKHLQMVQVTWPILPQCPYMVEKTLKIFFLEPKGGWLWNLLCTIGSLSTIKSVQMMPIGLTLTHFMARSDLVPMLLYEKKLRLDFSETIVVYDIKVSRGCQLKWVHEALWVPKVKAIHWPWSKHSFPQ